MDIEKIEQEINQIKSQLMAIGPMRPGSLTCQYKDPKEKRGANYQISYTLNMKSRTDYVKLACVDEIREQVAQYKLFKELTERWVELAIQLSNLKMKTVKRKKRNE
jgi:hypothetical protein